MNYEKEIKKVMANDYSNIKYLPPPPQPPKRKNTPNNHLSSQTIEHKKDLKIFTYKLQN